MGTRMSPTTKYCWPCKLNVYSAWRTPSLIFNLQRAVTLKAASIEACIFWKLPFQSKESGIACCFQNVFFVYWTGSSLTITISRCFFPIDPSGSRLIPASTKVRLILRMTKEKVCCRNIVWCLPTGCLIIIISSFAEILTKKGTSTTMRSSNKHHFAFYEPLAFFACTAIRQQ